MTTKYDKLNELVERANEVLDGLEPDVAEHEPALLIQTTIAAALAELIDEVKAVREAGG